MLKKVSHTVLFMDGITLTLGFLKDSSASQQNLTPLGLCETGISVIFVEGADGDDAGEEVLVD